MAWNGVPFPLIDSLTKDNVVLQITKLPTLMVDSGIAWDNIAGSIVAGCIPAIIAWKTIRYNNELIKRQVTLAAQQKKCDELREFFASYISMMENTTEYMELIFDEYDGDRSKIPFEKISEFKSDFYEMKRSMTHVLLIIGPKDSLAEQLYSLTNDIDNRIAEFFKDYKNNSQPEMYSLEDDSKKLLHLFDMILEKEQSKI